MQYEHEPEHDRLYRFYHEMVWAYWPVPYGKRRDLSRDPRREHPVDYFEFVPPRVAEYDRDGGLGMDIQGYLSCH